MRSRLVRQPPKRSGRPALRGGAVELGVHDYLLKPGPGESVYRMTPSALGRGCRRPGFTLIVGRDTRQNQGQPTLLTESGRPDLNRGPLVPQSYLEDGRVHGSLWDKLETCGGHEPAENEDAAFACAR